MVVRSWLGRNTNTIYILYNGRSLHKFSASLMELMCSLLLDSPYSGFDMQPSASNSAAALALELVSLPTLAMASLAIILLPGCLAIAIVLAAGGWPAAPPRCLEIVRDTPGRHSAPDENAG